MFTMIIVIIGSLMIGLYFGAMFTSPLNNPIVRTIAMISIMIGIAGGIIGLCKVHENMNKAKYNNGYCIKCEGKLNFVNATKTKNQPMIYIYQCEKCGHIIDTTYHE